MLEYYQLAKRKWNNKKNTLQYKPRNGELLWYEEFQRKHNSQQAAPVHDRAEYPEALFKGRLHSTSVIL